MGKCRRWVPVTVGLMLLIVAADMACAVQITPDIAVNGYVRSRAYAGPGANMELRAEEMTVGVLANLPNESKALIDIWYHPWAPGSGILVESAYYETPIGDGKIRIGKGRRMSFGITPTYPNRKTSNYGIVSESFTQDRVQGVQYMLQKGTLDLGLSLHAGYRLGARNIGEISGDAGRPTNQVQHLCFRDVAGNLSRKLEGSVRLGGIWPNGLCAGLAFSEGSLDAADLKYVQDQGLVGAAETSRTRRVYGLDFMYKQPSGFVAQGEWFKAKVSSLDYDTWNVLVGLNPKAGWKFFARYAKKDMDIVPTANQLTWDVKQLSLSAVQPLRKALWLQYEYEINSESPPANTSKVKNNLFFVELFSAY